MFPKREQVHQHGELSISGKMAACGVVQDNHSYPHGSPALILIAAPFSARLSRHILAKVALHPQQRLGRAQVGRDFVARLAEFAGDG
jgi:hypothetical protein